MDISHETPGETAQRLTTVIRTADFAHLPGDWYWNETRQGPSDEAIAMVRDETSSSQLVPVDEDCGEAERVGVFSFHFPNRSDNSGLVGWLATHLKDETGSGVFVVCGSNHDRGGIYDYWGYPVQAREAFTRALSQPRRGRTPLR